MKSRLSSPIRGARARPQTHQGFQTLVVRTKEIQAIIVPELGAKVISLKQLRTGREWLHFPTARRELFRNRLGDDFPSGPIGGWDECLPTIAACHCRGRFLPDHGEVWTAPWELESAPQPLEHVTTSIRLPLSPLRFTRRIALHADVIEVDYRLENLSAAPQPFLWAMHPLLALQPGDQLALPPEAQPLLASHPWLTSLEFPPHSPKCAKTFLCPMREGHVAVLNRITGDRLELKWDTLTCPALGIWLTRGGWHGQHHLALEPTNAASDSLTQIELQGSTQIPPHGEKSWHVELQLTADAAPPSRRKQNPHSIQPAPKH